MSTLELGSLMLALEFALLSWGVLVMMLRRQRRIAHEDHAHAGAVIEHLETNEVSRRDALATLFETTYRLEGEDLAAKVDEYVAREKAFYNAMLSLYLNRDGEKLKEIPEELTKVLTPWVHMTPRGMIHASEVSGLENEKAQLAAELDSTKGTLEQLMDEYMAAFKKTQPVPEEPPPQPLPDIEPQTSQPEDIPFPEADDLGFDQDDFNVQSGDSEAADPLETTKEPPVAPPAEEPIDPSAFDDLLDAFGKPDEHALDEEPIGIRPPGREDLEAELARQELEGLADLFEDPPEGRS